jgi:hypothetical protein
MTSLDINAVRCEALFASTLDRSQQCSAAHVQQAIRLAVREFGSRGCAARMAQEFGDHPEDAVQRMCWARRLVAEVFQAGHVHIAHVHIGPVHAGPTDATAGAGRSGPPKVGAGALAA